MNGFIHFLNCFDPIKDDATQSTSSNPPLIPSGQLHWCWAPLLTPSGWLKNINMPLLLIGLEFCLHFLFTDLQHTGIKLPNFWTSSFIAMPNQSKFNQHIIPHTMMPQVSSWPNVHVVGLWARHPAGAEKSSKLLIKATINPSCCEATVPTSTLLHTPEEMAYVFHLWRAVSHRHNQSYQPIQESYIFFQRKHSRSNFTQKKC